MAPSPCDQKKAEIFRLVRKECRAETATAEAIYDLECLEVKENYESRKKSACLDLMEQESKELAEKKRLYMAKMEPIKVKHAQKLAAMQEQYGVVDLEADPLASVLPETPSSPGLIMAAAEPGQKNSVSGYNSLEDSEDSDSSSDTSIPAVQVIPKATNKPTTKATFAPLRAKRKRQPSMEFGGDDDDDEPDSSQSENGGERDDFSDITFQNSPVRPSGKVPKASKRAPAQRPASSAPPKSMKNRLGQNELNHDFGTWNEATSPIPHGQAQGGDGDESIYSGPGRSGLVEISPFFPLAQQYQQSC
ncbi:hypothetical protein F5883DRAFT_77946 [Diaporthe sp. PMI_573]|nr:hypothetical protein F5883DRAFT_77946 [Diaporthaceae sp. PMI_573]